jgi:hypothetical protein
VSTGLTMGTTDSTSVRGSGRARLRPSPQRPSRLSRSFALPKHGKGRQWHSRLSRSFALPKDGNGIRGSAGASPSQRTAMAFAAQRELRPPKGRQRTAMAFAAQRELRPPKGQQRPSRLSRSFVFPGNQAAPAAIPIGAGDDLPLAPSFQEQPGRFPPRPHGERVPEGRVRGPGPRAQSERGQLSRSFAFPSSCDQTPAQQELLLPGPARPTLNLALISCS